MGSWIFNILPYLEEPAIHDLGMGQSYSAKMNIFIQRESTPLAMFICPTRRKVAVRPTITTRAPQPEPLADLYPLGLRRQRRRLAAVGLTLGLVRSTLPRPAFEHQPR